MTRTRPARSTATAPASIETQDQQARDALARAEALAADALDALDAAFAAFIADPTDTTARAYTAAHAHNAAIAELVKDAKAYRAEVSEAFARHRMFERERPQREAEAAKKAAEGAEAARIWNSPRNAERLLREAVAEEAQRLPFGTMTHNVRLTEPMLDAGLSTFLRIGGPGEPRFVVTDAEGWTAYLKANARDFLGMPEAVVNAIRRSFHNATADLSRVRVSAAAAQAPHIISRLGGSRT